MIWVLSSRKRWPDTHSILKSKQRHLQLANCRTIKIQLQFELREGSGDYFSVGHPHKIPQTCHQCGDVLMLQFGLLRALQTDTSFKITSHILWRHRFNRTIMSLIWPVSAPPAGEARSSLCLPSGFGVKSPSSRCLSSAWRNPTLSPPARAERCGPQSSPREYWKRAQYLQIGKHATHWEYNDVIVLTWGRASDDLWPPSRCSI